MLLFHGLSKHETHHFVFADHALAFFFGVFLDHNNEPSF
jgi:hypothetical protein